MQRFPHEAAICFLSCQSSWFEWRHSLDLGHQRAFTIFIGVMTLYDVLLSTNYNTTFIRVRSCVGLTDKSWHKNSRKWNTSKPRDVVMVLVANSEFYCLLWTIRQHGCWTFNNPAVIRLLRKMSAANSRLNIECKMLSLPPNNLGLNVNFGLTTMDQR